MKNGRIYAVKCLSGLRGGRYRLQTAYENLADFRRYDRVYNLARRLGCKSAKSAWDANPVIESSVEPGDYRKVRD